MVIAKETTLQELLEGSKQYRVPLYRLFTDDGVAGVGASLR